jgi:phage shock protein E
MKTMIPRLAMCVCLSLASCNKTVTTSIPLPPAEEPAAEAFMKDVNATEAGDLVKTVSVIDVRTPEEFAEGHIEGAVNVDFKNANFKEELGKLDRDKEYLIHCRSGGRSTAAKPVFEELGFKAIYHLDGGFIGWEEAELPVSK